MGEVRYNAHFIHRIAGEIPDEVAGPVEISDAVLNDNGHPKRVKLARAMRAHGLLASGVSLKSVLVQSENVVAYPDSQSSWHTIVLVPVNKSAHRIHRSLVRESAGTRSGSLHARKRLVDIDAALASGAEFDEAVYPESYKRDREQRRLEEENRRYGRRRGRYGR